MEDFKRGDVVTFRPEWQEPGDGCYIVVEDSDGGRVSVCDVGCTLPFPPVNRVACYMLEKVSE